jgi:hypothetical protein
MLQNQLKSLSPDSLDNKELSGPINERKNELKCFIKFIGERSAQIDEKIENFFDHKQKVQETNFPSDINSIDFKAIKKVCWDTKPFIQALFDEVKTMFETCVENSEPLRTFAQHFLDKAARLLCNVEKENFGDFFTEDAGRCIRRKSHEYEKCIFKYNPELFKQGFCE